jgi:hypothetical protein
LKSDFAILNLSIRREMKHRRIPSILHVGLDAAIGGLDATPAAQGN